MPTPRARTVQQEIRQRRPFRSTSHEAVVALFRTADLVRRTLALAVAPVGLTFQQYNVLRILRGAGPAGLPTLDVADRMIEPAPGITRMMDRLEAHGWVTRERSPTDRREVHCRISPVGLSLLDRLDATVDEADRRAMGSLDDSRLRRLIALLDEVRAAHSAGARAPSARSLTRRSGDL
jgi:MarR family transcriptional regulator, organic hydroperoxide resistance regulator